MSTVLVVTRELPYPPNAGDRIVTFGFLRCLARRGHEVHLLAYERADDDHAASALREPCASVRRVPSADTSLPTPVAKAARYAAGRSHVFEMFDAEAMREAVAELVRGLAPDVVLAEHPYMGQVFLDDAVDAAIDAAGARAVTNAHVVEYAAHERHREVAEGLATRAELRLETPRLRDAELAVYERSDGTLVLGEEDRAELEARGVGPVARQRVALDADAYEVASRADVEPGRLLFFGSYDWFPNEDGIRHFCAAVFPRIREAHPDVELVIAGRGATDAVRALADEPDVRFVGEVDELAPLVRSAAAVVAPLRVGGGVRIKVLESMAWGRPVVTSRRGFEGVEAEAGEDLLVADDPAAFADATLSVLADPERRERIARRGRRAIEETYVLAAVAPELEANLGLTPDAGAIADRTPDAETERGFPRDDETPPGRARDAEAE